MAPSPSVSTESHPAVWALTSAYTSTTSPAVTETAPAMSTPPRAFSTRLSGTNRSASAIASTPTGTFTKKIHCQESRLVSTPPSRRPTAPPPTATALQTPRAVVRSRPSANVVVRTERAAGVTSAPPSPCSARPATRIPAEPASPFISEAAENRTIPARNRRRRPMRSAARPPSMRKPPKASVYAFTIHCRLDGEKCSPRWIDGSATFTMVASRMTMNWAMPTITRTSQGLTRRGSISFVLTLG